MAVAGPPATSSPEGLLAGMQYDQIDQIDPDKTIEPSVVVLDASDIIPGMDINMAIQDTNNSVNDD
jgi:hypothetical protein